MHRPLPLVLRHHPRQAGASSAQAAPRALSYCQTSPPGPRGGFLVLRASARVPQGAWDSGGNAHLGCCCSARGVARSQTALRPSPQLPAYRCAARRPGRPRLFHGGDDPHGHFVASLAPAGCTLPAPCPWRHPPRRSARTRPQRRRSSRPSRGLVCGRGLFSPLPVAAASATTSPTVAARPCPQRRRSLAAVPWSCLRWRPRTTSPPLPLLACGRDPASYGSRQRVGSIGGRELS